MRISCRLFALALLALANTVVTADYQRGQEAYDAGDPAAALEAWRASGEAGDVRSQYRLGRLYEDGRGTPQDTIEAMNWYERAAKQGHAQAMMRLAFLLQYNPGQEPDHAEAVRWYREAAEAGLPEAQHNLANAYMEGRGVERAPEEAVHWYLRAAEQWHLPAMLGLAHLYSDGIGVPVDLVQAYKWVELPAAEGFRVARVLRDMLAARMTEEQIEAGYQAATQWRQEHGRRQAD